MANLVSEQFSRQQLSEFFGLNGKSARIVDEKRAGRMIEIRSYAEPTKSNGKVQRFCIFAGNAELAL
jgi:hypothetical protein